MALAAVTSQNLQNLGPSLDRASSHHRSVGQDYGAPHSSGSKKSRHSHSVHDRIQSHRSKYSSRLSQGSRKQIFERANSGVDGVPYPKFRIKNYAPSTTISHKSKESNGFMRTFTKEGKIYNDGKATYYSGRLFSTQKPEFNQTSSKTFNRTLRDRDTFLSVFPNYRITRDPKHSTMHKQFKYPSKSIEGYETHVIDRTYTRKVDFMKKYTEEMLKVASMKRQIK